MTELYPEWIKPNVEVVAVDTTAKHGRTYLVDVASNAVDIQLPAAAIAEKIFIKHTGGDLNTNALTITPAAGNIDGVAGAKTILSSYQGVALVSDGTDWFIV